MITDQITVPDIFFENEELWGENLLLVPIYNIYVNIAILHIKIKKIPLFFQINSEKVIGKVIWIMDMVDQKVIRSNREYGTNVIGDQIKSDRPITI